MPAGSLGSIAADSAFPALAEAMTEGYILPLLQRIHGRSMGLRLTGIDVLNHKPGRRCTIRYSAETVSGEKLTVIAKWYRDLDEAALLHRRLSSLEAAATGLTMPRLLAFDAGRGVMLQQHIDGRELRDIAFEGNLAPFAAAGEWLARLHNLEAPSGLEMKDAARESRKAASWAAEVSSELPQLADATERVLAQMAALSSSLATEDVVVVHRDFYPANLLWDGNTVWGIDFDQLALGDAGVDLGAFVAQTEKLALRQGLSTNVVAGQEKAFIDAYLNVRPSSLEGRLSFFRRYTLLHVASAEVRRKREGWRELTESFIRRAVDSP